MVDLDGTVDEVKERIRNASNPDYEELLEQEEQGKNRKTIIEFLEKKIGEEVEEDMHKSEEEKVEDELVEEIEEETDDGLLGGFNKTQVATGGLLLGILVGLVAGALTSPMASDVGPQQAEQTIQDLLTGAGSSATVGEATKENGLYKVPLSQNVTRGNQTSTQTVNYYLTTDGEKLIPESVQTAFGQRRPVVLDVQEIRDSQNQQSQNQTEGTEGNQTQGTENTTEQ